MARLEPIGGVDQHDRVRAERRVGAAERSASVGGARNEASGGKTAERQQRRDQREAERIAPAAPRRRLMRRAASSRLVASSSSASNPSSACADCACAFAEPRTRLVDHRGAVSERVERGAERPAAARRNRPARAWARSGVFLAIEMHRARRRLRRARAPWRRALPSLARPRRTPCSSPRTRRASFPARGERGLRSDRSALQVQAALRRGSPRATSAASLAARSILP